MLLLAAMTLGLLSLATPTTVLDAVRRASGGDAWSTASGLVCDGHIKSSGLTGSYHEIDDMESGYFKRSAEYGFFHNAEGLNASGRWRMDSSRAIHALNSEEASIVAVTEAYIARRGYLAHDRTVKSRFAPPDPRDERYYRVEIAPSGGHTATLWIAKRTSLLERIAIRLSERVEEIRFSDYRPVGALRLPFLIEVDDGDELDSGIESIASCRVLRTMRDTDLARPTPPRDTSMATGARQTAVAASVDARSGFLIVSANLNGRGPFPFVLDTGGHDILTPAAAKALDLDVVGSGRSYGAGSGTTKTQYASVASVEIGAARITYQPFTILSLDLGTVDDASGRSVPIAGILGLEIFERFVVTIDYSSHRLTLADARAPDSKNDPLLPLTFTSDMPLVRAQLNGKTGTFGVDTANNAGLIVFARWLRASEQFGRIRYGKAMSGESVGGSVSMRDATAERFALAGAIFHDVPIVVSDAQSGSLSARSEAGNIGQSILSRFTRITFDYGRGVVLFEPAR